MVAVSKEILDESCSLQGRESVQSQNGVSHVIYVLRQRSIPIVIDCTGGVGAGRPHNSGDPNLDLAVYPLEAAPDRRP